MKCKECDKDWFEMKLVFTVEDSILFRNWCNRITQCKYTLYLPDGSTIPAKMFKDNNGVYNHYSYKNYLWNRYNELRGI